MLAKLGAAVLVGLAVGDPVASNDGKLSSVLREDNLVNDAVAAETLSLLSLESDARRLTSYYSKYSRYYDDDSSDDDNNNYQFGYYSKYGSSKYYNYGKSGKSKYWNKWNTNPTPRPTKRPTKRPTNRPTGRPTGRPTKRPTKRPTPQPTKRPTKRPTPQPTKRPTKRPTLRPTPRPTPRPTKRPTDRPTRRPTRRPTPNPTPRPTRNPTPRPTKRPTNRPTRRPTRRPTPRPTRRPTPNPTPRPTRNPTPRPTPRPTRNPTPRPTRRPTPNPTPNPTPRPTRMPTLDFCDELEDNRADIVILVDNGCRLSFSECDAQNEFLSQLIERIYAPLSRVALWNYNSNPQLTGIQFGRLNDFEGERKNALMRVQDLQCNFGRSGESNLMEPLQAAIEYFEEFSRPGVQKKLILVNYCDATDYPNPLDVCFDFEEVLQKSGIKTFVLNLGDDIDEEQYICLTPNGQEDEFSEYVRRISTRNLTPDVRDKIVETVCTEPTVAPTRKPTPRPTRKPTPRPTKRPRPVPTPRPTRKPTPKPTRRPTDPRPLPTPKPTARPTRDDDDVCEKFIYLEGAWKRMDGSETYEYSGKYEYVVKSNGEAYFQQVGGAYVMTMEYVNYRYYLVIGDKYDSDGSTKIYYYLDTRFWNDYENPSTTRVSSDSQQWECYETEDDNERHGKGNKRGRKRSKSKKHSKRGKKGKKGKSGKGKSGDDWLEDEKCFVSTGEFNIVDCYGNEITFCDRDNYLCNFPDFLECTFRSPSIWDRWRTWSKSG